MNNSTLIQSLVVLGNQFVNKDNYELSDVKKEASTLNKWFTQQNIDASFDGLQEFLIEKNLNHWLEGYNLNDRSHTVGLVMAGNIPMVGFHDLLCLLISGKKAKVKLSSDDNILIPYIIDQLVDIDHSMEGRVQFSETLKEIDAVIATGSDNSSRYFEYYFRNVPHIIRKNRTSVGIINGNENKNDFFQLGNDILQYFGLGCRNISKLYVPENYDFVPFFEAIQPLNEVIYHSKYVNNYDYNKSIYLVNQQQFKDNGFLLLKPDQMLVSPLSVVFYEQYTSDEHLSKLLLQNRDKIQVMVSKNGEYPESIAFGDSQKPRLWDYADNVDTMEFLIGLS